MHPTKYLVGCVIRFSNSELRGRKVSIAIEVFFSQTNIYVEVDVIGRIPEERSLACFFNRLGHFKMAIGIGHGMELSGLNSKKSANYRSRTILPIFSNGAALKRTSNEKNKNQFSCNYTLTQIFYCTISSICSCLMCSMAIC